MPQAVSQGYAQGQALPPRKSSTIIAGIGAALVASAVTVVLAMSGSFAPPVATSDGASTTASNACQMIQRKFYVATETGGVVRLREGNYLSPPITLTSQPQAVVFPLPRPEATPVTEVLTIEGNSSNVLITSDVNSAVQVLSVTGVRAFPVTWEPRRKC